MEHQWVLCSGVQWMVTLVLCGPLCWSPVATKNLVVEAESAVKSSSITCWTCPNKTSNGECNSWAPDISCPTDQTVCRTVHRFEGGTGMSIQVHKECVAASQCRREHVGCWQSENSLKECVSCCTSSYCNKEVAVDNQTALQLSISLINGGASLTGLSPLLVLSLLLYYRQWGT